MPSETRQATPGPSSAVLQPASNAPTNINTVAKKEQDKGNKKKGVKRSGSELVEDVENGREGAVKKAKIDRSSAPSHTGGAREGADGNGKDKAKKSRRRKKKKRISVVQPESSTAGENSSKSRSTPISSGRSRSMTLTSGSAGPSATGEGPSTLTTTADSSLMDLTKDIDDGEKTYSVRLRGPLASLKLSLLDWMLTVSLFHSPQTKAKARQSLTRLCLHDAFRRLQEKLLLLDLD